MAVALPRLDLKESRGRHLGPREIRDAAVRRKRKARHALSDKLIPDPLPRGALVGEVPGHDGKVEQCVLGDSQGGRNGDRTSATKCPQSERYGGQNDANIWSGQERRDHGKLVDALWVGK